MEYLKVADVVLSTSKHESYGASIIEALAAGVPVVSLDVGVAREAGASVVVPEQVVQATVEILHKGLRGQLQLAMASEEEWAVQWRETLLS
jgi:glycosyltransferase involved in cell wall biosynthesis